MRHRLGSTGLLLLGLLLSGCTDSAPDPGGSGAATPTSAESSAPATSETTPDDPSETWDASPARGPLLELDHVTVRAPGSYRPASEASSGTFQSAAERGPNGYLAVNETPAIDDLTLRERALVSARNSRFVTDEPPRLAGFVNVNGVRMYHLTGSADDDAHYDEFGAVVDDLHVYIDFEQPYDYPERKRQRVIDSVLASMTWK